MERNGLLLFFLFKGNFKKQLFDKYIDKCIKLPTYPNPSLPFNLPTFGFRQKNICNDYIQKDYLILSLCHNTAVSYSLWLPQ